MLHIVCGAPCSGKSTYVRENAETGDVRVDFDLIAQALGSEVAHGSEGAIRDTAFKCRTAAINHLLKHADELDGWIIHSSPADWQMEAYKKVGAEIINLETNLETCLARAEHDGRPRDEADKIRSWFEEHEKGDEMRKTKTATLSVKAVGEDGKVTGYAATFDRIPDSYGDVIAKGAFTKSLEDWAKLNDEGIYLPLLYGHNMSDPFYNIGRVTMAKEDDKGLYIEADFDDSDTAQHVRKLVQEGRLYQFSFAYDVQDGGEVELEDGTKAYELRELTIFEVSLVQIPANPRAEVTSIKAADLEQRVKKLEDELEELKADTITDNGHTKGDPSASAEGKGASVAERISKYIALQSEGNHNDH